MPTVSHISALPPGTLGSLPVIASRWQDMSLDARYFYYVKALDLRRKARIFTVRLTSPTLARLECSGLQPREFIAQRVRDNFSDTSMIFALEASQFTTLHVHGILDPVDLSDEEVITRLKKVGGDQRKAKLGCDRVFHKRWMVDYQQPDWSKSYQGRLGLYGWARYMVKDLNLTRAYLGEGQRLLYVGHDVTRLAKRLHMEERYAA